MVENTKMVTIASRRSQQINFTHIFPATNTQIQYMTVDSEIVVFLLTIAFTLYN